MEIYLFHYRQSHEMNSSDFFEYIKQKYDEDLAVFICKDLKIICPTLLVALNGKQLDELMRNVYPDLEKPSLDYYTSNQEIKPSVSVLINLIKKNFTNDGRKKRKSISLNTYVDKNKVFLSFS